MSELQQRINDDVKAAMRSKDKERLGVLRLITAAFKQKEVDERIELDDTMVLAIMNKMTKQIRDSIDQFEKAGRDDLAAKEAFELKIIQEYLPAQLTEDRAPRSSPPHQECCPATSRLTNPFPVSHRFPRDGTASSTEKSAGRSSFQHGHNHSGRRIRD